MLDDIESTNNKFVEKDNNLKNQNDASYADFLDNSEKLIRALIKGVKDLLLQDKNLSLEISKNNLHIKINTKNGTYIIAKELETKTIALTSPLSGLFKYKYDSSSGYWISIKDNHILDELLIREFCHHSKGLLTIELS